MKIGIIGTGKSVAGLLGATGSAEIKDQVHWTPLVKGDHGKAWKSDLDTARRRAGVSPEQDATLVHWIIEAPWAHPMWHSYSLVLVHLRPMSDGRETIFHLPDATHEMWLYAVSPDGDRNKLIETGDVAGMWLSPCNFAAQFIEIEDGLAIERIERTVRDICAGKLSPDTDFRQQWVALFGDNMMKR